MDAEPRAESSGLASSKALPAAGLNRLGSRLRVRVSSDWALRKDTNSIAGTGTIEYPVPVAARADVLVLRRRSVPRGLIMGPCYEAWADAASRRLTQLREQTLYLQGLSDELNARVAEIIGRSDALVLEQLEQEISSGSTA